MTEHLSGRVVPPEDAHAYWNRGAHCGPSAFPLTKPKAHSRSSSS